MERAALERADGGIGHGILKDPAGRNAFDDTARTAIVEGTAAFRQTHKPDLVANGGGS